jgi:hypothetical protein
MVFGSLVVDYRAAWLSTIDKAASRDLRVAGTLRLFDRPYFDSVFEIWLKDRRDGDRRTTPTGLRRRAGKLRRKILTVALFDAGK